MKNKIFISLVLIFIVLVSCEKIIDINIPDKDKKIVINSIISTDSLVKVNVSKSLNILDNANAIFLNNAKVKLFEDNVFIEELHNVSNGNYMSQSFYPTIGKEYKIEVSNDGLQSVSAKNKIPNKVKINSIDTLTDNSSENIYFTLHFTDPANDTNYYFVEVKSKIPTFDFNTGKYTNPVMQNIYIMSDDKIVDANVSYNYGNGITFCDKLINGQTYPLKFSIDKYNFSNDTNKVYIYLNSISKDFYLYIKSFAKNIETQEDIFAEPVQVYENINNGYGIFAGYSSYVDSINVLGEEIPW